MRELFVSDSKVICEVTKERIYNHLEVGEMCRMGRVNHASHRTAEKAFAAKSDFIFRGGDAEQVEQLKQALQKCFQIQKIDITHLERHPPPTVAQIIYSNRKTLTAISFYTVFNDLWLGKAL